MPTLPHHLGCGPLMGGPQCRLLILRKVNVPFHYFLFLSVDFKKSPMSPVEFKKRSCRPVEFKCQGLQVTGSFTYTTRYKVDTPSLRLYRDIGSFTSSNCIDTS